MKTADAIFGLCAFSVMFLAWGFIICMQSGCDPNNKDESVYVAQEDFNYVHFKKPPREEWPEWTQCELVEIHIAPGWKSYIVDNANVKIENGSLKFTTFKGKTIIVPFNDGKQIVSPPNFYNIYPCVETGEWHEVPIYECYASICRKCGEKYKSLYHPMVPIIREEEQ